MSTLRISNIEAKADNSSPTVDEQLKFTNSTGGVLLHLDGRTSGITTVGINTTAQTIKFDENNNVFITGIVTATELHGTVAVGTSVTYGDNEKAYFGTGLDLQIFHNNSDSVISQSAAGTGNLKILSGGAQSIECIKAGAVNIAHNGTTKLSTNSTGVDISGDVHVGDSSGYGGSADNLFSCGASDDIKIYHHGSWGSSYINNSGSGALFLESDDLRFRKADGNELYFKAVADGSVELYHNNLKKIETAQTGAVVTGILTTTGSLEVRDTKANLIVAKTGLVVKSNSDLAASYDLIQLGAGGALASYSTATATADTQFIHNAYRHSGNNWKYRYADTAARLRVNSPARTWVFESAASGSADGDITWVEQLRITSDGITKFDRYGGTAGKGRIEFGNSGEQFIEGYDTGNAGSGSYLSFGDGSTERLRITSTGQLQATSAADVRLTLGSSGTAGSNNSVHIRADSADLKFMAASGGNTMFEVNGTQTLNITSAGIVQCGTSGVLKAEINNAVSGHQFISQCSDNNNGFEIYQQHGSTATRNTLACYDNMGSGGAKRLAFAVRGDGFALLQATSTTGSSNDNVGFIFSRHDTSPYVRIRHLNSNTGGHTLFHMLGASGNLMGEIKQDGSGGVTYHSASDYRLKENIVDLTGAITRLKNLKPKRFNFKISTDVTQDGFLAHELQEVVPIAVSGTKDEVVTDDSKSKIPTLADKDIGDPVYQTVDNSRVVPLLTAALQEAIAEIETLKTKVAALESS